MRRQTKELHKICDKLIQENERKKKQGSVDMSHDERHKHMDKVYEDRVTMNSMMD
jgi:hypothetical protein